MSKQNRQLGKAAEYRVLSELLLRGFKPYVAGLDDGVDFVLESGKKLQVKSARLHPDGVKGYNHQRYIFNTRKRYYENAKRKDDRRPNLSDKVDFVIGWGVNDDIFYIMPVDIIPESGISVYPPKALEEKKKLGRPSKYEKYLGAWDLLR